MNMDRIEALLWARIDGTIESEELAELEAQLAEHPEPRKIEYQITSIAEGLDNLGATQPPPELRGRISNALARATPPVAGTEHPEPTTRTHSTPIRPVRWLPLAASLLVGVAVGYLLHPGANTSIDRSGVTGSMLTATPPEEAAPVEIRLDAGAGSVFASRSGADIVVDVELTTQIDLGVTISSTGGPVRFAGLNNTTAAATEVTTEQGWVAVRTRGPGNLTLSVSATAADNLVRLQVSADGAPVEERWISPTQIELEP